MTPRGFAVAPYVRSSLRPSPSRHARPLRRAEGGLLARAALLLGAFLAVSSSASVLAQCFPNTLLQTIPKPTPAANDYFGQASGISGNIVVVGAYQHDAGATDAGAAFLFDATTGALLHTLENPAPAVSDWMGVSCAISGNLVVVGAMGDDQGASNAGSAYVFDATTGALVWTLNNPSPNLSDFFGYSVAIDGNVIVVGAYQDDAGAVDCGRVFVFDATTGALVTTIPNPVPAASDWFGVSVAVSGNLVAVGEQQDDHMVTDSGRAYVFDATTADLLATLDNPAPGLNDYFGVSVGISGNTVVVGSHLDDTRATNAGTAYVFDATTAALIWTLDNPAPDPTDWFGVSVAIEGNAIAVGAAPDNFGALDAGIAYVFDATTGARATTLNNPIPAVGDGFGRSIGISGSLAVVGANGDDTGASNAGIAYTFICVPPTPSPSPTPSRSPSPSPTPTESPTPSPTPTESPSPSPSPTESPTSSPSPSPSPSSSPTSSPSASPTAPPASPTTSPSPTASPSPNPARDWVFYE